MKKTLLLLALLVAIINSQECGITGCQTCLDDTTCDTCSFGLGYEPTPQISEPYCDCREGFYWDTTEDKCLACDNQFKNCLICLPDRCQNCNSEVSKNESSVCVQPCESLFQGCSMCTATNCTQCDPGRNLTINVNEDGCDCTEGFVRRDDSDAFCVPCYYFVPGCETCADKVTCSTCSDDFDINAGSCFCSTGSYGVPSTVYYLDMICVNCSDSLGPLCVACQDSQTCTECSSNRYYINAGGCSLCSNAQTNCEICTTTGSCITCYDPFGVNSGACSPCNTNIRGCVGCNTITDCSRCDTTQNYKPEADSNECVCIDESYDTGTGCALCNATLDHCDRCNSDTDCTRCVNGFFADQGSCSPCIIGCLSCDNPDTCEQCDDPANFELEDENDTCICKASHFLQETSCVACSTTLIGCEECEDENTCTQCDDDRNFELYNVNSKCYCISSRYYNSSSDACNQCLAVLDNCNECANSTYCDECETEYTQVHTFAPTESRCELCSTLMTGCLICATPTVCTNCDSANNFVSNSTSCQCAPAYHLSSGACQPCTSFSAQCTACTSSECTACAADYFLNASSKLCQLCTSTTPQCTACDSSGCIACATSYFLNATSKLCELCTSFSPQCTACTPTGCSACADDYVVQSTSCARLCSIELCLDCFNSTTCQFCVIHATLTADHTECNCNTGYFSDSTECVECSSVLTNCVACDNALECTACEDGFVVDLETDQCVAFESALKMASLLLVLVFAALTF